jgi:hypothetical protein
LRIAPPHDPKLMASSLGGVVRPPATLTTILPGAVFGPILTAANLGSVQIIQTLGFSPRPAMMTVVDCARSLMPV